MRVPGENTAGHGTKAPHRDDDQRACREIHVHFIDHLETGRTFRDKLPGGEILASLLCSKAIDSHSQPAASIPRPRWLNRCTGAMENAIPRKSKNRPPIQDQRAVK